MLAKLLILAVASTLVAGSQTSEGTIALSRNGNRSSTYNSGIVEIYSNGTWSSVCADTSFGQDEADVVCHQLGYVSADSYSNTTASTEYGNPTAAIGFGEVSCSDSDYLVLFQCPLQDDITCTSNAAVIVTCSSTTLYDSPYSGQVRLTGGTYNTEGLVEVYCNNEWGTVCNNSFDDTDANTICGQLGYNDATITMDFNGVANQPIWLNNVACTSSSTCLTTGCTACSSTSITSCDHNQDVSLRCSYDMTTDDSINRTGTCDFTQITEILRNLVGIIVGVVIAFIVIVALCIAIPLICCCICGIGCGAACCAAAKA